MLRWRLRKEPRKVMLLLLFRNGKISWLVLGFWCWRIDPDNFRLTPAACGSWAPRWMMLRCMFADDSQVTAYLGSITKGASKGGTNLLQLRPCK